MEDYNKSKESSYLQYWDVNHLYGWTMFQKLPVNNFERMEDTFQLNEDFTKDYNGESNERYFLEFDVQYLEKLNKLHNDLPFLLQRIKIEKLEKLLDNLHDKTEYVIYIRNLKQALNHELVLEKVHRVVKLKQNYIDMPTDLIKKAKNSFEKDFFELMINAAYSKTVENVGEYRDIKLVTIE